MPQGDASGRGAAPRRWSGRPDKLEGLDSQRLAPPFAFLSPRLGRLYNAGRACWRRAGQQTPPGARPSPCPMTIGRLSWNVSPRQPQLSQAGPNHLDQQGSACNTFPVATIAFLVSLERVSRERSAPGHRDRPRRHRFDARSHAPSPDGRRQASGAGSAPVRCQTSGLAGGARPEIERPHCRSGRLRADACCPRSSAFSCHADSAWQCAAVAACLFAIPAALDCTRVTRFPADICPPDLHQS